MSILSQNIERLRQQLGDNQTAFAARFKKGQSAASKWVKDGKVPDTAALIKMAELAHTTVTQFQSEPWNPGAAPEAQAVVMMPVSLPSAAALRRMFEALLETDLEADLRDELAQSLAQRLPAALARAANSPAVPVRDARQSPDEGAPLPATRRQPRPPERRT